MLSKKFGRHFSAFCAGVILASGAVQADPIPVMPTSTGSDVEITINESSCAVWAPCTATPELSGDLDTVSAMLGLGDSITFDFFEIIVGGLGSVSDATITATLAFLAPDIGAVASGQGSFFTFFGLFSGGSLTWDQPALVDLEDGSFLEITFEDLYDVGFGNSTTVSASIARTRGSIAVPEPGTLGLFGIGLIVIALTRRRTRKA